jgi:predicted Fe-Mo cluster-binding NifX family protein
MEGKTRIVVPTNDGVNIYKGMLGRAERWFIYEIGNGKEIHLVEKRVNPYVKTMQPLKTLDVYELIRDTAIIVAGYIGQKGVERLEQRGMKIFFRKGSIYDALTSLVESGELALEERGM